MTNLSQKMDICASNWPKQLASPALTGLAGEFVRLLEPHTESDQAALLVQFIAAFGSTVGRSAFFPVEADKHFLNLFVVLVGDSAKGRKGTSWGHILKVFEQVDPDWKKNCLKSGLSSGEGLIWKTRDPQEKFMGKEGHDPRLVTIDQGISDKRLCVVESEFASVLKVLERDGNKLSSVIRDAWDRGDLETLTKNEPLKATQAHVSIIGHITKAELLRYLTQTEMANGFGNRFLWICVKRRHLLYRGGNVPQLELNHIIEQIKAAVDFGKKTSDLNFDSVADEAYKELYEELSHEKPGILGSMTARGEPQILRIASIYALLDKSKVITFQHLMAAKVVWTYCEESCRYIFGEATGNSTADRIYCELQRVEEGLTQSQILENLFHRNKSSAEIHAALDLLQKYQLIISRSELTEGRSRIRWLALKTTFTSYELNDVEPTRNKNSSTSSFVTQ